MDDPAANHRLPDGVTEASAHAVILDRRGHLIAVNPSYKEGWDLPGGMVDEGETPYEAATREIAEEIGLTLKLGRLLVRDVCAAGAGGALIAHFVFDAPPPDDAMVRELRAVDVELIGAAALPPESARVALPPAVLRRLDAALRVREEGTDTALLEDGVGLRDLDE